MSLTTAGKIALISASIEYEARPLATSRYGTKYGMLAHTIMGNKLIAARWKVDDYDVYPSAIINLADKLKGLIVLACMDREFSHPSVMIRDVSDPPSPRHIPEDNP